MNEANIVVLHHDDNDGYCAAYAARKMFGKEIKAIKAVQYRQDFPYELIDEDSKVFILDFSYSKEILDDVAGKVAFLRVIDHHKTAADVLKDAPYAYFDMSMSGCELAWQYFFDTEAPDVLKYVGDRDIWRWAMPESHEVNEGIPLFGDNTSHEFWDDLIDNWETHKDLVFRIGRIAYKSLQAAIKAVADRAIPVEIEGKKVGFMNYTSSFSNAGNVIAERDEFDYAMSYFVTDNSVVFSLRGCDRKLAVNEIVTKFGGGGHRNAAGFSLSLEKGMELVYQIHLYKNIPDIQKVIDQF